MKALWLLLLACPAASAANGGYVDLAPFGQIMTWPHGGSATAVTLPQIPGGRSNFGLQWDDERDIREIHIRYAAAAADHAHVEYWVSVSYQLNLSPNCMARGSVCTFVIFPNWQPNWCTRSVEPSGFGGKHQ